MGHFLYVKLSFDVFDCISFDTVLIHPALRSRTEMGLLCPFQYTLRWHNHRFEEWGTSQRPFHFVCYARYVEVDLEHRVPGFFPGHHLWYRPHASNKIGLNFLTIGRMLARSSSEVVYIAAHHEKHPDGVTARYGLLRVSRAMELRSWCGVVAEGPLEHNFEDGDLTRWEIAPEAGPETVLCAHIPPHVDHITYYIADLARPSRDNI